MAGFKSGHCEDPLALWVLWAHVCTYAGISAVYCACRFCSHPCRNRAGAPVGTAIRAPIWARPIYRMGSQGSDSISRYRGYVPIISGINPSVTVPRLSEQRRSRSKRRAMQLAKCFDLWADVFPRLPHRRLLSDPEPLEIYNNEGRQEADPDHQSSSALDQRGARPDQHHPHPHRRDRVPLTARWRTATLRRRHDTRLRVIGCCLANYRGQDQRPNDAISSSAGENAPAVLVAWTAHRDAGVRPFVFIRGFCCEKLFVFLLFGCSDAPD